MQNNILVIDTAMSGIGVAVYNGARGEAFTEFYDTQRGQAEFVVPMVQTCVEKAGLSFADLTAIVVVNGPGTFTGLRIGMSAARSFALALDIPVYGISSFQALAAQYAAENSDDRFAVVLETKRSDFYFQSFAAGGIAEGEMMAEEAEMLLGLLPEGGVLIGDALARFRSVEGVSDAVQDIDFKEGFDSIDVAFVAEMFGQRPNVFIENAEPIYLRAADVSMPKKPVRVLAT